MTEDQAPRRATIRNAVIHITNEQPLMADLFDVPAAGDLGLLCTNLRTLGGKRPVFADHTNSTFFFPYQHIRFVEIFPGSSGMAMIEAPEQAVEPPPPQPEPEDELEIDEDFLRRIREV